ncbi:MAG: CGNR zinc finger domain-containing protein [Gaiellaceae bacterium]
MNSDLILDFLNTRELSPDKEELETPRALSEWLAERGLIDAGTSVPRAHRDEALRVREALRALLAAHNQKPADVAAATGEIDAASRRARLEVRFAGEGTRLEPAAAGARGAVGRILAEVSTGMADGTWERMKECRADDCCWVFLDTAKNRSRAWCSMRSCGNREKVRAYRERHQS